MHVLMTMLFVCQKVAHIGYLVLPMLAHVMSSRGSVSVTQPGFLPFSFMQKVLLSNFSNVFGGTSLCEL